MESNEETLADKLEQTLNSKNKLKGIINRLSSDGLKGISPKKFHDYDIVLKELPFLYNVRTIPGTVVAEFNKNNTPFNFNNNTEFKYYPIGGDADLNNGNRVISKQNLNLDSSGTEIKFDDLFNYADTATSFALNYSEAFGTLKKFKANSKDLYLNIAPNTSMSTPPWSVEDSPNLERLYGPNLHFYNNGKKTVFKNLPKLTYLSFSGSADTLPKLSTLYADCPKLETIVVNLTAVESPSSFDQYKNYEIFDTSVDTLHLVINGNNSESYIQGMIKPTNDISINKLILESNNTDNSITELILYTKDNNSPGLLYVKELEIAKDFDCCLVLGNFNIDIINAMPQLLSNLKVNSKEQENRYVTIAPGALMYYNEVLNSIKSVLQSKNWQYID